MRILKANAHPFVVHLLKQMSVDKKNKNKKPTKQPSHTWLTKTDPHTNYKHEGSAATHTHNVQSNTLNKTQILTTFHLPTLLQYPIFFYRTKTEQQQKNDFGKSFDDNIGNIIITLTQQQQQHTERDEEYGEKHTKYCNCFENKRFEPKRRVLSSTLNIVLSLFFANFVCFLFLLCIRLAFFLCGCLKC